MIFVPWFFSFDYEGNERILRVLGTALCLKKTSQVYLIEQTIICCSLNHWPRLSPQTALRKASGGAPGLASGNLRWKGLECFAVFDDKDQLVDICSAAWTWRAKRRGRKGKKGRKETGREQEALQSLQLPGHAFRNSSQEWGGDTDLQRSTHLSFSVHTVGYKHDQRASKDHTPIRVSKEEPFSRPSKEHTSWLLFPLQKGDLLLRKLFQN